MHGRIQYDIVSEMVTVMIILQVCYDNLAGLFKIFNLVYIQFGIYNTSVDEAPSTLDP